MVQRALRRSLTGSRCVRLSFQRTAVAPQRSGVTTTFVLVDNVMHHAEAHAGDPICAVGLCLAYVCLDVFGDTAYARAYGCQGRESMRQAAYKLATDATWRRWGANVSVSRATWVQVGPYDLRFTPYGWEDIH